MIDSAVATGGGSAQRQAQYASGGDAERLGSTARSLALPAARGVGETEIAVAKLT
ncbi:hypothetical protein PSYMP_24661 [Pseudomonas amygdali pv. morsprunorum str. M302280]|nr:hypothetical protein PSYMP_24661 [Pseudomonas amygdali pv. morsprunorum str. M302280]